MIFAAGRMTATARADIGAGLKPDRKAWVWGCVQTCDDGCQFSGNDLDWEFALCPRPGHSTGMIGGANGQEEQKKM
jgi:hypothetical protein